MSQTQSKSLKQHALESMTFAHGYVQKLTKDIPDAKALYQSCPMDNHVLWTLGHLATTYGWFAILLDAKANAGIPETWNALFGMDSKPSPDASKYPSIAEVRAKFESSFAVVTKLFEATPESQMNDATATDGYGFCSSKVDVALKCAWHDGYHVGQIASLRKPMGVAKAK